ncbi:hypothetical protein DUI87_34634 [Hirundo rustica rustica]|uniref:Uncharacterized protein n=1 Tax=Hirundo rustica rustica TaxID=333673 RepID=A0A3M0IJR9_HIRRU|nr:hypothetical protein DUI87_34955 [Hirundo rustica rustica]RMB88985.1 hypothetical protein DUI87_34634 [Hirundo rustica rustica]
MACCPSTVPGCLAGTAGVGPHWHSFIQCLQELSGALSRAHGTEHVLLNFHPLVRDALRQAQINGAEASEQNNFGDSSGIWPRLKRDRRRDGRSLFGPPGQLAKREQPGTGNEEERRRVSIPAAGKGDVRMGV